MSSSTNGSLSASFTKLPQRPTFSIQHDWETVLREFNTAKTAGGLATLAKESRQFWIGLHGADGSDESVDAIAKLEEKKSADSTASSVGSLTAAARSVGLNTEDKFDLQFLGPLQLLAHHAPSSTTSLIQAPRSTLNRLHPEGDSGDIFSVDVNEQNTLAISGGRHGSLRLWDPNSSSSTPLKDLKGHRGDIHLTRFFPSGSVALSAGLDLMVRIWACDTGLQATELRGHSRPITSVQFIERGRHLVTAAEDGQAKLWDVSKQVALATYPKAKDQFPPKFNDAILLDPNSHPLALKNEPNELPDATNGNLLLTGGSDGIVRGFDLRAQAQVMMLPTGMGGGVESLAIGPVQHTFTLGGGEGAIGVIELRKRLSVHQPLEVPLYGFRQDDAAITNIRPWSDDSFWTTNSTGSANLWQLDGSTGTAVVHLSGVDCEPIHDMCITSNFSYLASHQAVRVYAFGAFPSKAQSQDFHQLQIPTRRNPTTTVTTNTLTQSSTTTSV